MSAADWPVVAVIPVLERPWRARPVAESFKAATPHGRLVFVATSTDHAEVDACRATGCQVLIVEGPRQPGDWAAKINYGYRSTDEPLILLGGDDLAFHPGWHDEVANAADQGFGVIGTQDLGNRRVLAGQHSTHPVVARWYADEQGTVDGPSRVVSEVYGHNFPDQELVETACSRGAWVFCNQAVVEHLHPNWSKAQTDDIYRLGMSTWVADHRTYLNRRRLWGDI